MQEGPDFKLTLLSIGSTAELNVFELAGNAEAAKQVPMFGRGRLDHLGLQAASLEAFEEVRERLVARGASDGFVTDFGPVLSVFFTDPDGLEAEVLRHQPRRPARRLQPSWHPLEALPPRVMGAGCVWQRVDPDVLA